MRVTARTLLLSILTLVVFTGCLQYETVITVNADGSGRLEQTFLMSHEVIAMLAGVAAETQSDEGESEDFSLLNVDELRSQAEAMGEGVRYVSAEPKVTEWGEGYAAVFDFDDISALRVNQNPGENVPDSAPTADEGVQENLTFEFQAGTPATLTVHFPETEEAEDADGAAEVDSEGMGELLRQIYRDMRIRIAVDVNGRVVATNASYRDGNVVTLMDLDFNAILDNPEATERLLNEEAGSVSDLKALAEMVPGIKVETVDPVWIRFR